MASAIALDSGALIALSRGDDTVRAILRRWTRAGYETVVPCPVLSEVLRGTGADAAANHILNARAAAVTILPVTEADARDAGMRIGRTARKHVTVDALIVSVAVAYAVREILTGDPTGIEALAGGELAVVDLAGIPA